MICCGHVAKRVGVGEEVIFSEGFFLFLRYFFVCVMDLGESYYAEKERLADDGNGIDRAVINVLLFLRQISSKPIKN